MQHRLETFWSLVQEDRLVRWASVAGAALVWLAVAWLSPLPLVLLGLLAGATAWVRKRRPIEREASDELF